jgi:hypothetical protein
MKTVAIKRQSKMVNNLLEIARREDVLVQTPEGDEFLLVAIDDFDREIARQRCNKKLMTFLDKRFRAARREKGIPLEEVRQRLSLAHRKPSSKR